MKTVLLILSIGLISVALPHFCGQQNAGIEYADWDCGGHFNLLQVLLALLNIFATITAITGNAGLQTDYLLLIFKVVGIAYLGEFAAQLCRDADQGSIAQKIEMGVKIIIMLMALPLLQAILDAVIGLLS